MVWDIAVERHFDLAEARSQRFAQEKADKAARHDARKILGRSPQAAFVPQTFQVHLGGRNSDLSGPRRPSQDGYIYVSRARDDGPAPADRRSPVSDYSEESSTFSHASQKCVYLPRVRLDFRSSVFFIVSKV
jgi:hypothetical protein